MRKKVIEIDVINNKLCEFIYNFIIIHPIKLHAYDRDIQRFVKIDKTVTVKTIKITIEIKV